ncbi:beta-sandwich lipoprotein [Endozoicomonas sp. 2B-B]
MPSKTGPNEFKKHFLGLSDNVTYFAEQMDGVGVSVYHNRIIWKPQSIMPNIDINGSTDDLMESMTK